MKLNSYVFNCENDPTCPDHATASFNLDKGESLDEIVQTFKSIGTVSAAGRAHDQEKLEAEIERLKNELLLRAKSHERTSEELKKALKDFANSEHALQEIQGTYTKLASAAKDLRLQNESLQRELDTAKVEISELNSKIARLVADVEIIAPPNGPVGEDPQTGGCVYEGSPVVPATPTFIHDPVDEDPEETDENKSPADLFRESFTQACANIKGKDQTEVMEQALAVYNARKAEAIAFGLQREFGNALRLAIADNLKVETDYAGALFSARLDAIKGKAADAAKAEQTPALVSKFKEALELPLVRAKNSPRQKIVGALAVATSDAGKVKLSDMAAAAEILRPLVMEEKDWKALLEKGSTGKSQLEILSKIVAQGLDLTLV